VVAHSIPSTKSFSFINIKTGSGGGGGTVPRTIIWIDTVKSYLIDYNSIFYALNTLPDLLRPAVICYFVVGSVVGRTDHHGFSEISTRRRDGG